MFSRNVSLKHKKVNPLTEPISNLLYLRIDLQIYRMGIFGFLILIGIAVFVYKTYFATSTYSTKDERFNAERNKRQKELDLLLDKIAESGLDSLSEHEQRRLDELSGKG